MFRALIFAGLLTVGSTSLASTSYDPGEVYSSQYQAYFESLQLHYETPRGCIQSADGSKQVPTCELAADLNGDGSTDYVAFLEYIGGNLRGGNSYLDMVILFSSVDTGEVSHLIYKNVGKVDDNGNIDRNLQLQPSGEVNLPSGPQLLEQPAINVLSANPELNRDFFNFPTFAFIQDRFTTLNKAQD